MKNILRENNILVPTFTCAQNAQDIIKFFNEHGPKIGNKNNNKKQQKQNKTTDKITNKQNQQTKITNKNNKQK